MNAFPAELVQHHYACMLVAGLLPSKQTSPVQAPPTAEGEQPNASSTTAAEASSSAHSGPSLPSDVFPQLTKDLCDVFTSRGRSTAWDPARANSAVFHTVLVEHSIRLPPRKTRPTPRTLAAAPTGQQSTTTANLQPRSPLSPLHPSSPLFPDGLIAPIWLRKHRELVPAVFVVFHCLAESALPIAPPPPPKDDGAARAVDASASRSEAAPTSTTMSRGLSGAELKVKDEELIRLISERKRSLSERGIKLTVVLLTTRAMLESNTLEQRLSYIRRTSQLDARASLFVLTPVPHAELADFVGSLQTALFDPALDYYREHFRRVRRKRTKYPPSSTVVAQIMLAAADIRGMTIKDGPLNREGWLVRSDYKMATFAELGGNLEEAFKHYTDAYNLLVTQLLTSTLLLPPRTKRWAEAKVLADTLSFRISKLLLYRNDGDAAWDQFHAHVKKFTELSQGWGIGEMTFEFWSWLGKQYRLMGDLLDLAMRDVPAGSPAPSFRPSQHFPPMPTYLLHPSHLPMPTASGSVATSFNPQHGNLSVPNDAAIASFVNAASLCPGAGECFYIAGVCALERWERFRRLSWNQERKQAISSEGGYGASALAMMPTTPPTTTTTTTTTASKTNDWGITNLSLERKVDHSAQAIEALIRAHEVFKCQRRHRLSLFVASKIANAYIEAKQNELALRFLERTTKSYQLEGWPAPLVSQLLLALVSAQSIEDVESEGRALWRLLGAGVPLDAKRRQAALDSLNTWLATRVIKAERRPLRIECSKVDGPLQVDVVFGTNTADLDGKSVPFQIKISTPAERGLEGITFDRLMIQLRDGAEQVIPSFIVDNAHQSTMHPFTTLDCVDLRSLDSNDAVEVGKASLSWPAATVRVFEATVVPRRLGVLQVTQLTLERDGEAPVRLHFDVQSGNEGQTDMLQPRWYVPLTPMQAQVLPFRTEFGGVEVERRKHKLTVSLTHKREAYLDEAFVIQVAIQNDDDNAMACVLDVHVLGPQSEVLSVDEVWSGGEQDGGPRDSLLRGIDMGDIMHGAIKRQNVTVRCSRHTAPRKIDFVLRSKAAGTSDIAADAVQSETITSISLPVRPIFSGSFYAQWRLLRSIKHVTRNSVSSLENGSEADMVERTTVEEVNPLSVGADDTAHVTAIAALNVALSLSAPEPIEIELVSIALDAESKHLRVWRPAAINGDTTTCQNTAVGAGTWQSGDRWGGVYDIEMLSEAAAGMPIEAEDASLRSTGVLSVKWRRAGGPGAGSNIAKLALPLLLPPHLLARLIVSLPASTTTEQPLVMLITIVNPSRLAADIFINVDDTHADFALQSHPSFTVPNLMPRSTRSVPFHVVPRRSVQAGVASVRTLPQIRAWQRDRRHTPAQAGEQDAATAKRSSLDGGKAASLDGSARPDGLLQIVNQRPGAGVPLEVSLRYTSKTAGGVGTTAAGAAVVLPTAPTGMHGKQGAPDSAASAASSTIDVAAHLQAETQRTGMWTVFVH